MIPQQLQPKPIKATRVRIYGPETVNGMTIWRVMDMTENPWRQIGPPCFSHDEALERAREAAEGRKVIWFGGTKLVPRKL